jgi:multiple sugar transport system permease protein
MTLSELGAKEQSLIPQNFTLGNYYQIILGGYFYGASQGSIYLRSILPYMGRSLIVAISTAILAIVMACPASYAYSRYNFKGKNLFFFTMLVLRSLPPIAIIVPFFMIIMRMQLINTLPGIILAHVSFVLPFSIWIFREFLDGLPKALDEAAFIDGASPTQTFLRIIMPNATSGLFAVFVFAFITSWSEFLFALVLLSSETTLPPLLAGFQAANQVAWTQLAAASVISVILPVILVLLTQKYLVKGLAAGITKGI